MITVHHLEHSRSQRVLWLLEELGLEYEIKRYERDRKTSLAPSELKRVHPLGKSPVIDDDGRVVAESGAIIEYLVDRHGQGRLAPPAGSDERLRYTYWLHFAEGSAMPPLLFTLVCEKVKTAPMPFFVKPIARGIALSADDIARAWVIERLMCDFEFSPEEAVRRFGRAAHPIIAQATQLSADSRSGLQKTADGRFAVHPGQRLFVRTIAAEFDAYLKVGTAKHSIAV